MPEAGTAARRRMPAEDAFWLELDRPDNLMVVTSLLWTAEEVDPGRLRAVVRDRMLAPYPVLRSRPELRGTLLRRGTWVEDRDFDLDRHVVVRPAPGDGGRDALRRFVGEQRSTPLDPAHPMWRMHLLQGYEGGSALVTRFHHSIADGIRATQVMLGLLDPVDGTAAAFTARVGRPHPRGRGAGTVLRTALGLGEVLLWVDPPTALAGRPGVPKSVAWSDPVPLALVKRVAARTGTTVNDVCTALVCGAMARHLDRTGRSRRPRDDEVAWMVPVNLAPPDRPPPPWLGNHFALVLAVLPHGRQAFPDRLAEVHRRIARIRDSWEPGLTYGLSRAIALAPPLVGTAAVRFLAAKAVGVLTDVPGPRAPMALAGAPVAGIVGWAPTSGRQALTVTVFSYAGEVTVGFGADPAVVPDAGALVTAFEEEVGAAMSSTGVGGPPGDRSSGRSGGRTAGRR
ncbi:WS/DGAT domain-containing protein [Geodermatophilus sp. SYSU D00684]